MGTRIMIAAADGGKKLETGVLTQRKMGVLTQRPKMLQVVRTLSEASNLLPLTISNKNTHNLQITILTKAARTVDNIDLKLIHNYMYS